MFIQWTQTTFQGYGVTHHTMSSPSFEQTIRTICEKQERVIREIRKIADLMEKEMKELRKNLLVDNFQHDIGFPEHSSRSPYVPLDLPMLPVTGATTIVGSISAVKGNDEDEEYFNSYLQPE